LGVLPSRRRLGWFVLALGVVLAAAPLVTALPEERSWVLRIGDPQRVERVEMLWLDPTGAPLRQTTLSFAVGAAPHQIARSLSLAEGRYVVVATLWRDGAPERTERTVDIVAAVSEIVVPVP
jgi:hypothetical protein